jgi:hypothetical protein
MLKSIILDIATFNWILAMILTLFSNTSSIISKIDYKRALSTHSYYFSIKSIREVIELAEDLTIKKKLKQKIILRKASFCLMISTPILIFVGNVLI